MAKVVPDFGGDKAQQDGKTCRPDRRPMGMSTSGMGMRPSPARFMAWIAMKRAQSGIHGMAEAEHAAPAPAGCCSSGR